MKFTEKLHSYKRLIHHFFPNSHKYRIHSSLCESLDSSLQPQGAGNTVRTFTMERNTPARLRWFCSKIDVFLCSCYNIYHCKKGLNTPNVGHDVNIVIILI